MTTTAVATSEAQSTALPKPVHRRRHRRWTSFILPTFTTLVMAYLILPIVVMIVYSFNQGTAVSSAAAPKVSFRWQGFTTSWWHQWRGIPDLTQALSNSIVIAVTSTIVATILGTLIALATVRHRFRGHGVLDLVMFLNIAAPEIVLGASLLSFFVLINFPRGLFSVFVAHVMFNIAFVAVTVRARLSGFHREIDDAAADLYATPWQAFWRVTLPLTWPGILAGALLAFALSIDDFVITNFVAGQAVTFPLWVYGAVKVGIPPQVFVMGTMIFGVGVAGITLNILLNRRRRGVSTRSPRRARTTSVVRTTPVPAGT